MSYVWRVPCLDIAGRVRSLTVRSGTGVALGWPAAEYAALDVGEARALVGLLRLAERVGSSKTTTGIPEAGGESTAGVHGGGASSLPHPAVPELAVAPACASAAGVTAHHGSPARSVPDRRP